MSWEAAGRLAAVVAGLAMIVAAIVQDNARDGFAVVLVFAGVALVLGALGLPRLREMEVGPQKMRAVFDSERQATAELANDEPTELETSAENLTEDDVVPASRALLAWSSIERLRRPAEGPLAGCRMDLYLYDADTDLLVPVRNPDTEPTGQSWRIGQGATGAAYETGEYVVVEGDAVSDDTYGLSPEQQERYRGLTAVAAMPVLNSVGEVLAVLTAYADRPDSPLTTFEGFEEHLVQAQLVARVLIDLLKWFTDG